MPVAFETISFRDLVRRLRVPALVLAAVAIVALLSGGLGRTLVAAFERMLSADPAWAVAAAGFEVLSFAGYIALTRHVTGLAWSDSYRTTLAGAAATRLLPTAGAGGAALTLWVLRRRGRDAADLLTFLVVLYAVFLAALLAASLAAGLLVPAAVAGAAMLAAPFVPKLSGAVRRARALLRRPHVRLLGAPAWWLFDCAVLWAAFHAVGAPPAIATVAVGYFLGQVANTIPLPGAASSGMIGVFVFLGVAAPLALAAVATYRAIAIWLPAPLGAHALTGLRSTLAAVPADPHAEQPLAA